MLFGVGFVGAPLTGYAFDAVGSHDPLWWP